MTGLRCELLCADGNEAIGFYTCLNGFMRGDSICLYTSTSHTVHSVNKLAATIAIGVTGGQDISPEVFHEAIAYAFGVEQNEFTAFDSNTSVDGNFSLNGTGIEMSNQSSVTSKNLSFTSGNGSNSSGNGSNSSGNASSSSGNASGNASGNSSGNVSADSSSNASGLRRLAADKSCSIQKVLKYELVIPPGAGDDMLQKARELLSDGPAFQRLLEVMRNRSRSSSSDGGTSGEANSGSGKNSTDDPNVDSKDPFSVCLISVTPHVIFPDEVARDGNGCLLNAVTPCKVVEPPADDEFDWLLWALIGALLLLLLLSCLCCCCQRLRLKEEELPLKPDLLGIGQDEETPDEDNNQPPNRCCVQEICQLSNIQAIKLYVEGDGASDLEELDLRHEFNRDDFQAGKFGWLPTCLQEPASSDLPPPDSLRSSDRILFQQSEDHNGCRKIWM